MRTTLRIIYGKLTLFAAAGLTAGGIGAIVALAKADYPFLWFTFSSFVPIGPIILYYSLPCTFRKELKSLADLKVNNLVTDSQYKELRQAAVRAYKQQRFGDPQLAELEIPEKKEAE